MVFSVKYRKEDGTLDETTVEAESRTAVFPLLEKRGIKAIRVDEAASKHGGWNKPKGANGARSAAHRSSLSAWRGIAAGALVVALAVGGYFAFFASSEKPQEKVVEKKPATIKEVKPVAASVKISGRPISVVPTAQVERPVVPIGNVITARTASTGRVMTLMDGTVITNIPRIVFKRDFERGLMVALRPGGMTRGIFQVIKNKYSEDQILSMLKETIIPDENDDDDIKVCKRNVQALKERILVEVANGRSVMDIINEIQSQGAFNNLMRANAMKLRAEAVRSGDPELVRKTIDSANKVLEKQGLKPLQTPIQFRDSEKDQKDEFLPNSQHSNQN